MKKNLVPLVGGFIFFSRREIFIMLTVFDIEYADTLISRHYVCSLGVPYG